MGESESNKCKDCPVWRQSAFAVLGEAELAILEQDKQVSSYQRGDAFSVRGQPAQEVYCLKSGGAKVSLQNEQSKKQSIVRLVEPGDMLGYRCIFTNESFRATASALSPSVACKISKTVILNLIERNPKFSFELLRRMGQEIGSAEYHHHSFCQKNVRERLDEALLILFKKFGKITDEGCKIDIRLTRTELANWIGTSRETVIRELSAMIQESRIRITDDIIWLLQVPELSSTGRQNELPPDQLPPTV